MKLPQILFIEIFLAFLIRPHITCDIDETISTFPLLFEYSPLSIRLSRQLLFRLLIFALRPGVLHVFLPSFSEGAAHWCR